MIAYKISKTQSGYSGEVYISSPELELSTNGSIIKTDRTINKTFPFSAEDMSITELKPALMQGALRLIVSI